MESRGVVFEKLKKYFLMVSFPLYIHIFLRNKSFIGYVERKLQGTKNPIKSGRYLIIKEYYF